MPLPTPQPSAAAAATHPGPWAAWLAAVRPRSLPVAVSPVLVGAALGWQRQGSIDALSALLILLASLMMQVVCNMQNDVGYTARGAERSGNRTGLPRATALGWLGLGEVRGAIVAVSLLSSLLGLWLFARHGWPVLAIGSASLLAALAYMGGPRPIAYTPFGELTVFAFFGLVAVCGSDWVLTGEVGAASIAAGSAIGTLAAAALTINNHRDIAHDRSVGRRTFAVCFGARGSLALFTAEVAAAFVLLPAIAALAGSAWLLLPLLLAPRALALRRDLATCPPGLGFNGLLFRCFLLQLAYAALLSAGAVLARLGPFGGD